MKINTRCYFCRQPLYIAHHGICSVCLSLLPVVLSNCIRCGQSISPLYNHCSYCEQTPPPWNYLIAVGPYISPIKQMIQSFKFKRQTQLAPLLARLLLIHWLAAYRQILLPRPDIVIAVPLHKMRRWQRGFNQSELLARPLAFWLRSHYHSSIIEKIRATKVQSRLKREQRRSNLERAFRCRTRIDGLNVALVDDVVTSGETVGAISRLLISSGAKSVQILCIARTL